LKFVALRKFEFFVWKKTLIRMIATMIGALPISPERTFCHQRRTREPRLHVRGLSLESRMDVSLALTA
jgi:hypothetical protein